LERKPELAALLVTWRTMTGSKMEG